MKALTHDEVRSALEALAADYDVRAPIALHDGTRALGRLDEGPLALPGGRLLQKITSAFFPQTQRVLTTGPGGFQTPPRPAKPFLVVGLSAPDAACLDFIDRFFAEHFRDDLYFARRDGAVVVCVTGRCGRAGEFLRIAGRHCDLELICDGEKYLLASYSQAGHHLAARIRQGVEVAPETLAGLREESDALSRSDEELIRSAASLLQQNKVPEAFWQTVADRCIACTSCNLACPTCTCFDFVDRTAGASSERSRIWDSCQLDGFMREASGHNPMGKENLRTRRRIHHKLAADPARWGTISCFLCGRCDEVCPTGIGIKSVCREIVRQYGPVPVGSAR